MVNGIRYINNIKMEKKFIIHLNRLSFYTVLPESSARIWNGVESVSSSSCSTERCPKWIKNSEVCVRKKQTNTFVNKNTTKVSVHVRKLNNSKICEDWHGMLSETCKGNDPNSLFLQDVQVIKVGLRCPTPHQMAIGEIRIYEGIVESDERFSRKRMSSFADDSNAFSNFVTDVVNMLLPFQFIIKDNSQETNFIHSGD